MKPVDVAIIGRGIAGLAVCRELLRRGQKSIAVIGPDQPVSGSATIAAQGVCATKGLVLPQDPLFAAKLASHRQLPGWIQSLANDSGLAVSFSKGGVGEVFTDLGSYQSQLDRAYHKRFTGVFGPEFGVWSHDDSLAFGLRHPEDFWFDPLEALNALDRVVQSSPHRVRLVPELVTALEMDAEGSVNIWSAGVKILTAAKVVIAAGFESPRLMGGIDIKHRFNWSFSEGETFVSHGCAISGFCFKAPNKVAKDFKTATFVHGTKSITVDDSGRAVLGSTARPCNSTVSTNPGDTGIFEQHLLKMAFPVLKLSENLLWRPRWGVRLRVRDRRPLVGSVSATASRLWLFTGFYKNGLQLAPFLAPNLAEAIESNDDSSIPREFSIKRFEKL